MHSFAITTDGFDFKDIFLAIFNASFNVSSVFTTLLTSPLCAAS
jgi:hypothetical protein